MPDSIVILGGHKEAGTQKEAEEILADRNVDLHHDEFDTLQEVDKDIHQVHGHAGPV